MSWLGFQECGQGLIDSSMDGSYLQECEWPWNSFIIEKSQPSMDGDIFIDA